MMVARSPRAYDALVAALAQRAVDRRYLALVQGIPDVARGVVDAPIGRSARHRTRMAVTTTGRAARTTYEVRSAWVARKLALLECRLESGRTHQVRVHLSAIGHSVIGDGTYGGASGGVGLDRPFLHAYHLGLDHPITREQLRFDQALPSELRVALADLGPPDPEGGR
jgi:23S rRNA pseudouridine1911/1915/1917 synthase